MLRAAALVFFGGGLPLRATFRRLLPGAGGAALIFFGLPAAVLGATFCRLLPGTGADVLCLCIY